MKAVKGFLMSFSMFCAIPCPIKFWDEGLRPMMTAMLPAVGLTIGAVWALAAFVCQQLGLPGLLSAALLAALPWMLSGYIHLDGFMDSCDAILSRRELAERQRILKDPHTGSFAVISLIILAMVTMGAFYEADLEKSAALIWIPVITRALSAIAVQKLKAMGHSQYAGTAHPAYATVIPAVCIIAAAAGSIAMQCQLCTAAAVFGWCAACFYGYKQLDGMSGDISGYAITVGEACAAVAFAFI